MEKNENTIPLYPYNGRSLNLIDKFYIFGYNYLSLKRFLLDQNPGIKVNKDEGVFKIEEEPSTLNEITHDFKKQLVDPETIKKLIFPNSLFFYYIEEKKEDNNYNKNKFKFEKDYFTKVDLSEDRTNCPTSFRSIFSCSPLEGKNSRKCQNGFAYTFYRKFWKKKEINGKQYIFYIPYTFCIISEYTYYKSFEKLFRCIRKMFAQPIIYIPIEILLYKIVLSTPSPLNTDVILDLDLMCNQGQLISSFNKNATENELYKSSNTTRQSNKELKETNFTKISKDDLGHFKEKQKTNENPFETKLKFKYLSGYPLIQFNLAKVLFHTLSIENIIKVFIFSFLEKDIVFFSESNEYLTLTINAYGNFNYPLNDAEYFYNIGAISLEAFQKNDVFGIKNSSSIIAINNKYVENFLSNINRIDEYLIVDLDKGILPNEYTSSFTKLIKLIENICREKSSCLFLKETNFYRAINRLFKRLKEIYDKKEIYFDKEFIDFNEEIKSGSIDELNKSIQEAFYESLIFLSLYYYENIIIEQDKNEIKIKFIENCETFGNYTKEESLLLNEMKESMKFKGSFSQFVMYHNPIDLLKIPLTFTEEFLSVFSRKKINIENKNIKYFDLIDKLYLSNKLNEIKTLDFSYDMSKYIQNFKDIIDREIQENNKNNLSSLIKIGDNQGQKILTYQSYELDENIIIKYNHLIKNLPECQYYTLVSNDFSKEENLIKEIDVTEVETEFDKYMTEDKIISPEDLCSANIILLFSICLESFPDNFESNIYLSYLFQIFKPYRKHLVPLLRIIYKLYKKAFEENNNKIKERMNFCFFKCFNYIGQKRIVPNENLMIIINKINSLISEEKNNNFVINNIGKKETPEGNDNIRDALEFTITEKNLHIHYNFTYDRFYNENYIVDKVNTENRGSFELPKGKGRIFAPKIRYLEREKDFIECGFICQKDLYEKISKEYNKYFENLDFDKVTKFIIIEACLNIFIFLRNNKKFKDCDDIIKIIEIIFYIFKNIK